MALLSRWKRALLAGALCATLPGLHPYATAQTNVVGEWTPVITWGQGGGIEAVHVSLLPTGKILFWSTWRESVGLWDPVTAEFSSTPYSVQNPFCAGHAWLPDGRLLVAGGHVSNYNGDRRSDIYDPFTNTWASASGGAPSVPTMGPDSSNTAATGKRWYPSATTLGNGDVLVMSGDVTQQGVTNRSVQIYRTATNTWSTLAGALRPADDLLPQYPRVFLAPDGRAISMSDNSNQTEWLNVTGTGSWIGLSQTLDSNLHNYGPAVMYDTGKIAYIGGGHNPTQNINMLDLTAGTPTWQYGSEDMAQGRRHNNATIMADGTVLITGGTSTVGWNDPTNLVATPEIWNPETQEVTQVAPANAAIYRGYHSTATLLPDGRVLVTGGDHNGPGGNGNFVSNNNAEIYSPAYLFKGARPSVTAAPDVVELGDTIFVQTPNAADIAKALWVVPGSTTHAQNWTQRSNILDFTMTEGGLNIDLPANGNEAPPGYYMLFLVNSSGVPSMAEWMKVELRTVQPDSADFNGDLKIDGADWLIWQRNQGGPAGATVAQGDANDDGVVDADDLAVWRTQFGTTLSGPSLAVPEPVSVALLLPGIAAAAAVRRGSAARRRLTAKKRTRSCHRRPPAPAPIAG